MSSTAHRATPATDDALQRRVVAKVARRLVPFMALMYFVNYLDRTNIGFAKLTMAKDLALTETMFGLASGLFFIGYLVFEVPSNLAMHRFGARRWIARILVSWGIVAAATAFVPNHQWLYGLRILLGIAEAGFFPGMILYLTYWFPARDRARITGMFLVAIPLSSALGATLSGLLVQNLHGFFGLEGWRAMFLVEAVPAVILGVIAWFYLTDRPDDATWLSAEERTWLTERMAHEQGETERAHGWSVRKALTSGRVLALSFVYFGVCYGLYALSFFLPTIVAGFAKQFGTKFSLVETGMIVAVPFLFGAVAMVANGHHSDKTGERRWHVAVPAVVAGVSIPVALYQQSPFAVMVAITFTAIGVCAALPVFWSLPSAFLTGAGAAAGIALINSLGNISGFAAPFVTGFSIDLTGSAKPALWMVGALLVGAAVITLSLGHAPRRAEDDAPVSERSGSTTA